MLLRAGYSAKCLANISCLLKVNFIGCRDTAFKDQRYSDIENFNFKIDVRR